MKIVYLHGLESNVNQKDPKIIFLNNNFDEVFTPSINYKDKNTFAKLFSKIKAINPDLIVGSSMGGYFAYLIGSKLSIETVLFNPAVVGRAFDPIVDDTNLSGARHNVFLGKSDNVISGKDIKSYLDSNGVGNFKYRSYKGGHRVPEDTFINSIKNIAGIKENDSSQIYTKRKYIKMKHIKTSKSINEAKMPFSVEYFDMGEWFEYEYDGGYKSEKDAMEVAKEIADSSGDKVRILKNGKKVKLYESSEFVGGMITEAVLSLPAFAALMLTTGILGRLTLMSDDKFDKLVGQTKSDVKGIGKIFKQGFLDYAKLLPVVGKKLKYKALQNLQRGEVAKYLKDEITDADIVKILKEDPKLKTMIEDIANGSKRYSDLYNHLRSIGGHKEGTWGEGMIANKFKKLRAKIAKGSLDESVNEGKKYTVSDFKVGDRVIIARGETKPGVVKKVTKAPNDLVYVSWNPKRPSDESQAFRAHELIPESVTEAKGWNAVAKVMDAALKKANVSLSYAKEYAKSLEGMAKRDAKEFFADYGDFTEDDFIEDVEYNMRNESVTESLTSNYRVHSKYVRTFESINQSKYTNLN
jgi:hypothetical protein|tara:strand:+ start:1121 stop:2863 length:1743 start_codon:yes stop_codon:yes gene_type:complete